MNDFSFKPQGSGDAYREAHRQSDADFEQGSLHHTLGSSPTQAAPGNHNHDEDYSATDHNHDSDYSATDHTHPVVPGLEVGMVVEYPLGAIADEYLEYNGQSVLRADYPELFALWGVTFGAADADHFNVGPDTADRFAIGESGTKAVGDTGGSATSALPNHVHSDSHTHTISDHTHPISAQSGTGFVEVAAGAINVVKYSDYDGHSHGGVTGAVSGTNPQVGARSDANTGNPTTNPDIAIDPPWYATRKIVRALP